MAALTVGSIFATDYRVLRPLAAGGMGAVYVALQLSTGRERALKVMLGELASNEDLRRRFEQEAKIGAEIESEHVVEVVGAGVDRDTGAAWLAMEYLQGEDLRTFVRKRGPQSREAVRDLFIELAHAVGAAHRKQIVHRDLKPENIFLSETRRARGAFTVKVLDFGIAKLLGQARTSATAAMGTPLWMAPEQAQNGARISPAADVWALGLIAFYCLTGRMFWRSANDPAATPMMVMREVLFDAVPSADARAAELGAPPLPAGFGGWFARCLDRDPGARFRDASAAYEELERVLVAPSARPQGHAVAAEPAPVSGAAGTLAAAPLQAWSAPALSPPPSVHPSTELAPPRPALAGRGPATAALAGSSTGARPTAEIVAAVTLGTVAATYVLQALFMVLEMNPDTFDTWVTGLAFVRSAAFATTTVCAFMRGWPGRVPLAVGTVGYIATTLVGIGDLVGEDGSLGKMWLYSALALSSIVTLCVAFAMRARLASSAIALTAMTALVSLIHRAFTCLWYSSNTYDDSDTLSVIMKLDVWVGRLNMLLLAAVMVRVLLVSLERPRATR